MKKRKVKVIRAYSVLAVLLLITSLISFLVYFNANRDYYINYSEKSDLDYKVYLKENNYFNSRFLGKNNKYIASLIDYISADFSYKLTFPTDDMNYNYTYKVMAELSVKDKDDDITYYEYSEELFRSGSESSNDGISIDKSMRIEYNKYNDIIKGFVKDFDLDRSQSELKVSMYVTLLNSENEYLNEINNSKVISLNIPLTTKTVSIDMSSDLHNNDDGKILVKQNGNNLECLVLSIASIVAFLFVICYIVIYYIKNRTPHALYKRKLKAILNNYSSYIQEINNTHKIGASMVYKLKSFDDLLEVRETIQKPILMIHNSKNTGTFFIIPANEYTIYSYALRVVDIVADKKGLETPDYNVNNLTRETIAERKFTKQYIDSQIDDATRTITMRKLDADNVILGNKSGNENIYEQLEKTTSYKLSDLKEAIKNKKKTNSKSKTKKETSKVRVSKIKEKVTTVKKEKKVDEKEKKTRKSKK